MGVLRMGLVKYEEIARAHRSSKVKAGRKEQPHEKEIGRAGRLFPAAENNLAFGTEKVMQRVQQGGVFNSLCACGISCRLARSPPRSAARRSGFMVANWPGPGQIG